MSLRDLLKGKLPDEKLHFVPKGFEVIGDIAIINIPPFLDKDKYLIARVLLSHRKDVSTVLGKTDKLQGTKRLGDFEVLIGNRTATIHKENDCIFHVDITKTYFSGKLAYERARIARMANEGENVLVLFCGVGPFLIPIGKKKNIIITGVDSNPAACTLLGKNVQLNDVDAFIILGDANSVDHMFKRQFDRIVMPAPYGHDHFLNRVQSILKPGGIVHFYSFKKDFELGHFKRLLEEKGWRINFFRNCGGVAPRVNRYVFDMQSRS